MNPDFADPSHLRFVAPSQFFDADLTDSTDSSQAQRREGAKSLTKDIATITLLLTHRK